MKRGHVRHTKACSAKTQENILVKAGVDPKVLYFDDLKRAIPDQRRGDELLVVGLLGLAGKRSEIVTALEALHARGAAAVDAETGRRSDGKDGAALMAEAVDELSNHRRGPGNKAAQAGSKGGIQSAKNGRKGRMPFTKIRPIWFNGALKDDEVMALVNGDPEYPTEISYTTIWRQFGARNGARGRRRANKS